ncbi:MAG TPA: anti-sigma F factor antagonist [Clostridia bacterium]|nr:anti-sigma F factor antagonist [Clostridia bacterium]
MDLKVEGKKVKDILVIYLKGELDHHTAGDVRTYMDNKLEDPTIKNIVLDIGELGFMDSSGIGVLIGRYKIVSNRGGKLGVAHINSHIHRIFEVSGLYKIIKPYKGLQEALNDMGGH